MRELLYFWEDVVSTGGARSPCRITDEILAERDGEMVEGRDRADGWVPPNGGPSQACARSCGSVADTPVPKHSGSVDGIARIGV